MKVKHPLVLPNKSILLHGFRDYNYEVYHKTYQVGINLQPKKQGESLDVCSVVDSKVITITDEDVYLGLCVVLEQNGTYYRYFHLDSVAVDIGDKLKAGQVIGTVGRGVNNSMIDYLHFSITERILDSMIDWWHLEDEQAQNGLQYYQDPVEYLAKYKVVVQ